MKNNISPAAAAVIIVIVVAIAVALGWKTLGPRTDGAEKPIDMGKMMGKGKAPYQKQ
jgi:hypothetical protein